jgi:hypothetical protein
LGDAISPVLPEKAKMRDLGKDGGGRGGLDSLTEVTYRLMMRDMRDDEIVLLFRRRVLFLVLVTTILLPLRA